MFEQTCKKFLDQILCLLSSKALPAGKPVKRSPISSTENFECPLCSGRWALRFEYDAPMSGGKRHGTAVGALNGGRTVHELMLHKYAASRPRTAVVSPRKTIPLTCPGLFGPITFCLDRREKCKVILRKKQQAAQRLSNLETARWRPPLSPRSFTFIDELLCDLVSSAFSNQARWRSRFAV